MKRFLIGLLFLAAFGLAMAQPPVDYQLWCGGEGEGEDTLIGVVSIVKDHVHVAVLAGVTCEGEVLVEPAGAPFTAALDLDSEQLGVILIFEDEAYTFKLTLVEVPQEGLDGMVRAQELRTRAAERRAFGRAQAEGRGAGMRPDAPEDGDELEVEAGDGPPEWVPRPRVVPAPRP